MVCKKQMTNNGILEIYIREVIIGTQEKVVLWVDSEIFNSIDEKLGMTNPPSDPMIGSHRHLIKYYFNLGWRYNVSFILHSEVTLVN